MEKDKFRKSDRNRKRQKHIDGKTQREIKNSLSVTDGDSEKEEERYINTENRLRETDI